MTSTLLPYPLQAKSPPLTKNTWPSSVQALKHKACALLSEGLAEHKHEDYRYTPLHDMLTRGEYLAFGHPREPRNHAPAALSSHTSHTSHTFYKEGYVIPLVDGLPEKDDYTGLLPQGVEVLSLKKACQHYPERIAALVGRLQAQAKDAYAWMNTAAFTDGLFMHVDKKVSLDKPLILLHTGTSSKHTAHPRHLFYLCEGAEASVVEVFQAPQDTVFHQNMVHECVCEKSATLRLYKLQDEPIGVIRNDHTFIATQADAKAHTYTFSFGGRLTRNHLYFYLEGKGSHVSLQGLYIPPASGHIDNYTSVEHRSPHTHSSELYKGILTGAAHSTFNGKIYILKDAQKCTAYQSNKNMLLSEKAVLHTKPQLEILADDVRCSHGCTTGVIDPQQLFYMRTRGIGKAQAHRILLESFAQEVLDLAPFKALQAYLRLRIQRLLNEHI